MASSTSFSLLIIVSLIVCCKFSAAVLAVAPAEKSEICENLVSDKCGFDVYTNVFNGGPPVALDCCVELIEMGKECHASLVAAILPSPIYKHNRTVVLERGEMVWNLCSYQVKGLMPAQLCEKMNDGVCGKQIVHSIFHGYGNVNLTCCRELIQRGKVCHDALVNIRLSTNQFENNRTVVLKRSGTIWNDCAARAQLLPALKKCKDDIGNVCGRQIGESIIFNKGQVSAECCGKLLNVGRDCHDLLAQTDVALPQYQARTEELLEKSAQTWIKCYRAAKHA